MVMAKHASLEIGSSSELSPEGREAEKMFESYHEEGIGHLRATVARLRREIWRPKDWPELYRTEGASGK